MRHHGFTLLELIITIATMGVIFTIATLAFNSMNKKANVESQVRTMFADLMSVRSQALYQKKDRTVTVTASLFAVYSSTAVVSPVTSRALSYSMSPGTTRVDFDSWGGIKVNNDSIMLKPAAVCVGQQTDAAVDSIVISRSRIELGKLTGTGCDSDNITIK